MSVNPVVELMEFAAKANSVVDTFLLESGWHMTDRSQWQEDFEGGPLGECYRTAWNLALDANWTYVEGYATTTELGIPLMHAWCLDEVGDVVDPTWPNGENYYGVAIPREIGTRVMLRAERYSVLGNLWALRDRDEIADVFFQIAEANGAVQ